MKAARRSGGRRRRRKLKRNSKGFARSARELTAGVLSSLSDFADSFVDKESIRVGYNYVSGAVRGMVVTIVTLAIVLVGYTLKPFLSNSDKRVWRRMTTYFEAVWATVCIGLINPVRLIKTGEFPDASTKPKLLICNHVTDVDWVYLWILALRTKGDRSGSVKIMMKDSMSQVPLFGQGMKLFDFIFLKRNWEKDQEILREAIERYTSVNAPVWIVLFPEGTTINTRSMVKSTNYAKSLTDAPELKYTLLPRSRGFEHILNMLQEYSDAPEVFDITLNWEGFSGEIPTWEMGYTRERDTLIPNFPNLLSGSCSDKCFMDSTRFSVDEIKAHPLGIEGWLNERWARKDRLTEEFIEAQRFPGDEEDDYDDDSMGKLLQAGPILAAGLFETLLLLTLLGSVLSSQNQ